jgi:hypothetical protein
LQGFEIFCTSYPSAQQKMAEDQHQMALDIADMKERIAAIEKMLREIE